MKFSHIVAAGGLLLSLSMPAVAQMHPSHDDAGMHRNDPGPGPRGDMRGGPGMHDGGRMDGPRHRDGYRSYGRHCRTVWYHHHRVRRCMR